MKSGNAAIFKAQTMAHTGSKLSATATEWGRQQSQSGEREMEENGGSDGGSNAHWWWALAGVTQFGWGIASFRRGVRGDSSLMPFKAFAVASLFVGAAASSAIASLKASDIHKIILNLLRRKRDALLYSKASMINKVEDVMEVGANIRNELRIRPRARDE